MKASLFETTMNDQILRQQNQEIQKQNQKKQHERKVADSTQLEVVQEESKIKGKRKKQSTLLTKRRRVAEALNKKQVKTGKATKNQETSNSKLKKLAKQPTIKETTQADDKDAHLGEKLTPAAEGIIKHFSLQMLGRNLKFNNELEDLEFLQNGDELEETNEANETHTNQTWEPKTTAKSKTTAKPKANKLVQEHMAKLSPKDKKEYLSKILNGNSKEILDTLINPKYLIGSTMTPEQLLLFRKQVQKKARFLRGVIGKSIPEASRVVRDLGYGSGLGNVGEGDSNSGGASKPPKDESPNSAILESMEASLDLTSLLEKLGVQSNIIETSIESSTATEEVSESKAIVAKNLQSMHANFHRSKCAEIIKILSYVAAAILIAVGQPEAGLLVIATTSGLMQLLIKELAKAIPGMSEFGLKCLIMAITLIVAVISANPEIMGEEADSLLASFGKVMLVSATIGFTTDLLGEIATGHGDASKYPSWVTYAAMGINIGAMLPEIGVSMYRGVSRALAKAATIAAEKAAAGVSEAEAAMASALTEAAAVSEVSESVSTVAGADGVKGASAQGEAAGEAAGAAGGAAGGAKGEPGGSLAPASPTAASDVPASPVVSSATVSSASSTVEEAGSASVEVTAAGAPSSPVTGQASSAGDEAADRTTVAGAAKADKVEEISETDSGEDANGIAGIDTLGGTNAPGSESYSVDQAAAGDTTLMEEAKDEFTIKAEKMGKAIEQAKADLSALQRSLGNASEDAGTEVAEELASQVKAAEEVVAKAEKELQELVDADENLTAAQEKLDKANVKLDKANKNLSRVELKEPSSKQGRISKMKAYLNSKFGDIGKVLLIADSGAQAYAQFQMAEIDTELGHIMSEVAELTGNYDLLNSFFEIIGAAQQATNTRNDQYSKDLHDEIKLVGDIINAERSASNILMSA